MLIYITTCNGILRCHIQSVHKGAIYECSQCDYETTWKDTLTRCIKSTHSGVKCDCNYFDFRAIYKLTRMNSKYPCQFVKSVLNGKDLYNSCIKIIL